MNVTLAIETTQRAGGVALRLPDGTVARAGWDGAGPGADTILMPTIAQLLRDHDVERSAVTGLGVSAGPGGFTGTRIGISTAKMLGLALGIPLAALPTAMVVAEALPKGVAAGAVLITLASKRNDVWTAELERAAAGWRDRRPPGTTDAADVALDGIATVVGDAHMPDVLRARCAAAGLTVVVPDFDPEAALRLTESVLRAGRTVTPADLLPLYARPPEAVRLWRARRASASSTDDATRTPDRP